jgi:hypothetical protein
MLNLGLGVTTWGVWVLTVWLLACQSLLTPFDVPNSFQAHPFLTPDGLCPLPHTGTVPATWSTITSITRATMVNNFNLTGCLPSAAWVTAVAAGGGGTNTRLTIATCP